MAYYPPERKNFRDPVSGRAVTQWTSSPARDNHLYFTSHSITLDDRWLAFLSGRDGNTNLYAVERPEGRIHRLTAQNSGTLRSYCWPAGGLYGISKASPVLDERRNVVFYIQDDALWRVELGDPKPQKVWALPVGWWSAFNHVSPDGKTVCVPLAHPYAFPSGQRHQRQQLQTVPRLMHAGGFGSRIYMVDVATGKADLAAELPFWVTHVQFDPTGTGRVIFNQEGDYMYAHARTWCLETTGAWRKLYDQPAADGNNHENWSSDGSMVVYHGYREKVPLMAGRRWDGTLVFEWTFPNERIAHTTPLLDASGFITDGGEAVSLYRPGSDGRPVRTILAMHDAVAGPHLDQDDHVHPLVAPHGRSVVFSSNREGVANVYEVLLDNADLAPRPVGG